MSPNPFFSSFFSGENTYEIRLVLIHGGGFYRHEGRELYIRNIDFQATEKDLLDLFKRYGQVEKIRIPPGPRKGTHKGFGFIAFATKVRHPRAH